MTEPHPRAPGSENAHPPVGDVGAGEEGFGASLYHLYYAGRVSYPFVARRFSQLTRILDDELPGISRATSDAGSPAYMTKLVELCQDLQVYLGRTATNVHRAGEELVIIADRYVATDEGAEAEFKAELDSDALHHRQKLDQPVPPWNPPPKVDRGGSDSAGG